MSEENCIEITITNELISGAAKNPDFNAIDLRVFMYLLSLKESPRRYGSAITKVISIELGIPYMVASDSAEKLFMSGYIAEVGDNNFEYTVVIDDPCYQTVDREKVQ